MPNLHMAHPPPTMPDTNPIFKAHLRIARPTPSIQALLPFYTTGLGFETTSSFAAHEGFAGVMLGHASLPYHLEFTAQEGHDAGRCPTKDHLLVFYLPERAQWEMAVERMEKLDRQGGVVCKRVQSWNPWWEQEGKGRTYEDADGWRAVLFHGSWTK